MQNKVWLESQTSRRRWARVHLALLHTMRKEAEVIFKKGFPGRKPSLPHPKEMPRTNPWSLSRRSKCQGPMHLVSLSHRKDVARAHSRSLPHRKKDVTRTNSPSLLHHRKDVTRTSSRNLPHHKKDVTRANSRSPPRRWEVASTTRTSATTTHAPLELWKIRHKHRLYHAVGRTITEGTFCQLVNNYEIKFWQILLCIIWTISFI